MHQKLHKVKYNGGILLKWGAFPLLCAYGEMLQRVTVPLLIGILHQCHFSGANDPFRRPI